MNINSIDQLLQAGKKPASRLFIALAVSLILIGCSSSDSDGPTVIQGETTATVEQTDSSQEQVDTPGEQVGTPVDTDSPPATEQLPSAVQLVLDIAAIKTIRFSWEDVAFATSYRLLENADGISGFTQVGQDIQAGVETIDHIVVLYKRTNASYVIQSCNAAGCVDSAAVFVSGTLTEAAGYIKASNNGADNFGSGVSLSADSDTLAIGAFGDNSSATGINGDQTDNSANSSGAVYVFTRTGSVWEQQAYIKASNTGAGNNFGSTVSLSADGNTLAVGSFAGTAYVFTRSGSLWEQQADINASNADGDGFFGSDLSLSADGNTLVVRDLNEDSSATGINGDQADNSANSAGAVYVFTRNGSLWEQQAYIKASNTDVHDLFGFSVSLSANGNTLAVGALHEDSSATGINGDENDNLAGNAGAVYVFTRDGSLWEQQAYLKASNTDRDDFFGNSVSLSADGNMLVVGASREDSSATGINVDVNDNSADSAGAVYVFSRSGSLWEQQAYLKASNTGEFDSFGNTVSLSANGHTLAVGALHEDSSATGINGDENDNSADNAGAVYVFTRSGSLWEQRAYIKASNTDGNDIFGNSASLSADGNTLAVGAREEQSNATGINGNQADNSVNSAGAVYLY